MMLVSCYALVEKGNLWDVSMIWKNVYVSLILLYVHETCYVKNEGKQVKTMCKSLPCGWIKKRSMRSNRRETWGSWNLPP